MKRLGADCMFLDISHKPADFIRQHFPMIYEKLLGLGIKSHKNRYRLCLLHTIPEVV